MANEMLGKDGSESLSGQLRTKMEQLRESLERANPVNRAEQS